MIQTLTILDAPATAFCTKFVKATVGIDWIACAEKWQTLISGLLAIFAALIGAFFVYHQTCQTRNFELDRLNRRHAAARSTMPLLLSNIVGYSRTVGRDLRRLYLEGRGADIRREALINWEIPQVPKGEIAALASVIEAASNDVAQVIADLLGRLQVQSSRLNSLKADITGDTAVGRKFLKSELEEYILDIADIHARCEILFAYARREAEKVQPVPLVADKLRALFLMGFHEHDFDNLRSSVERRGPSELPVVLPLWRKAWNGICSVGKPRT